MILFYKTKNEFYQTKGILTFIFLLFLSINAFGGFIDSNNPKISLNVTNVSLELVLSKIEAQSDYTFFYESNSIDLNRLITIKITNESIELVLPKIFDQKKVSYSIVKHQIILKKIISYTIKGILVNKTNNKIIPYCSISLMNSSIRTSSNELGEFEIKTTSLPAKVIFSHHSYQKRIITITNIKFKLTIPLTSLENVLDEIVIKTVIPKKRERYAADLAKKAYKRILSASRKNKNTYAKAFYRQKSKNDNEYTEFFEIFFDLHYNINGIKQWNIIQGRYALKRNSINNKNFTLFSRILKSTQPKINDLIFPLNENVENYYTVNLVKTFILDSSKIAVIKFTPIKGKKLSANTRKTFSNGSSKELPIFEGEAYINTSNYDLLKMNYHIHNDKIKLIRLKEKNAARKNHKLSYEITFRKDPFNSLVIDYIKVDQEFDYYKDEKFITRLSSTSNLTFFEYYTNTSTRKRMRKQFNRRYSDWQKLNLIGYNNEFWENNPMVKRTPIEKKVIADFEKRNKFQFIKKPKQ
mgnify:CR=1 FL=1